jgi:hypothetical protein
MLSNILAFKYETCNKRTHVARQPNEVSDYTPFSDVESWLSKLHKPPFHGLFTRIPDRRLRQDDLVSVIMTIVGPSPSTEPPAIFRSPKILIHENLKGDLIPKFDTVISGIQTQHDLNRDEALANFAQAAIWGDEMARILRGMDSLLFSEPFSEITILPYQIDVLHESDKMPPSWRLSDAMSKYLMAGHIHSKMFNDLDIGEPFRINWYGIPALPISISDFDKVYGDKANELRTKVEVKWHHKIPVEKYRDFMESSNGEFHIEVSHQTQPQQEDKTVQNSIIRVGDLWEIYSVFSGIIPRSLLRLF